ncbi:hypothetical protein CDV55_102603 [Aspergillus turcosus]|nr:hypothetical protein CDV55_102603 [Aspergillus turcosus]
MEIAAPTRDIAEGVCRALGELFDVSLVGPAAYYLGMQIELDTDKRQVKLSQRAYLQRLVDAFDPDSRKTAATPMEEGVAHDSYKHKEQAFIPSHRFSVESSYFNFDIFFKNLVDAGTWVRMWALLNVDHAPPRCPEAPGEVYRASTLKFPVAERGAHSSSHSEPDMDLDTTDRRRRNDKGSPAKVNQPDGPHTDKPKGTPDVSKPDGTGTGSPTGTSELGKPDGTRPGSPEGTSALGRDAPGHWSSFTGVP